MVCGEVSGRRQPTLRAGRCLGPPGFDCGVAQGAQWIAAVPVAVAGLLVSNSGSSSGADGVGLLGPQEHQGQGDALDLPKPPLFLLRALMPTGWMSVGISAYGSRYARPPVRSATRDAGRSSRSPRRDAAGAHVPEAAETGEPVVTAADHRRGTRRTSPRGSRRRAAGQPHPPVPTAMSTGRPTRRCRSPTGRVAEIGHARSGTREHCRA